MIYRRSKVLILVTLFILFGSIKTFSQCGGIMEPGFAFLSSSRGCAPYTVNIQTLYLSSVPGTTYYVNWGDGTAEEVYTQISPSGVTISHNYPNVSVDCGYDVVIDASNACNPRGSVVPLNTQVIVWTNDIVSIDPGEYRVCQGFAATMQFTDNSTWNCFPRAARENNEPRWIQWIYGTGPAVTSIPGIQVNSQSPATLPYLDPAPGKNPQYPVLTPGQLSLPINIPATTISDIGKEFVVSFKNWNQCNPYDNNLLDGNAFNPISGDLINGDNAPRTTSARVVIVPAPQANFLTRLGSSSGIIRSIFCIGDNIYFDDETPGIAGSNFSYSWEFFDNSTGTGTPVRTSTTRNPTYAYATPGVKLIRLSVRDQNAVGGCVSLIDKLIEITPSLVAKIQVTDLSDVIITPDFCQNAIVPLQTFQVRVRDASVGTANANTQWKWEFYNQNNVLVRQEPATGFSNTPLGPFDLNFTDKGVYRVKLIVRDIITSCQTEDEISIRVFEKPRPAFIASRNCEGATTQFTDNSTLQSLQGETISLREWDFNYDGVTFQKDPAFDNQTTFSKLLGPAQTYQVALRVSVGVSGCSEVIVLPVVVDPLPSASFTPDVLQGCSILTVNFTNTSIAGQPAPIDKFIWEIDERDGFGFKVELTQDPSDPAFTPVYNRSFENVSTGNKLVDVRLRAINTRGCETISPVSTITVFPGTQSGFTSVNYSPFNNNCSPQTINFQVDNETQSRNPANYQWTVADENGIVQNVSTGTVPAFSFTFTNNTISLKDYSVSLTTTLSTGCFGDSTRLIRVSPVPVSLFTIDTLQFDCELMQIQFTATQKGLSSYRWVIEEGGIVVVNSTTPSDIYIHTITRPPGNTSDLNLKINLTTRNFANCASIVTSKNIMVPKKDNISAGFNVTPLLQSLPTSTVSITNLTNPGPWEYLWDFGDGTTSTDANITSHTYSTFGVYVITLTVRSTNCFESQSQQIEILAIPPIVDFEADPTSGCMPLTVNFKNLSQFADPNTYQWDFGDESTSQAINPSHTYYEPGKYTVTLTATNITGQKVINVKQGIIEVFARPKSGFDLKPNIVYAPDGILYTNNRSFDAVRYLWDFGDGTTSTAYEPQHSYIEEGVYTVTLTAFNQYDCADSTKMINGVKVIKGSQILFPNAFSPRQTAGGSGGGMSDGKNDYFLPMMRGVVEFELMIFNRWGTLLYQTTNAEAGWDGTYLGKECQPDVYVYKFSAKLENGDRIVRAGDVNLIR
jgi:gliding motility-associated-like protein